jgi:B12-binding domain/radical SAM domain protein
MAARTDVLLLHAPAVHDFRHRRSLGGPVSDLVPSTPIFEMYPIGFLTIADFLERNGYRVRIHNAAVAMLRSQKYDVARALRRIEADVIGIDLHWLVHAQGALELAAIAKSVDPRAHVVLGGLSTSYFHEDIIRSFKQVDFCLRGDSTEVPFLQLLESFEGKRELGDVENLTWRDGRRIRVNRLTHVPGTLDHIRLDYRRMVKMVVRSRDLTGHLPYLRWPDSPMTMALPFRGCVHDCLACGGSRRCYSSFLGRKGLALRKPSVIAEEMSIAAELVSGPVFVVHDPRMAGDRFADELLSEINARSPDARIIFEYFSMPPVQYIRRLARAIPRFDVQISPESHDESVRRAQGRIYSNTVLEKTLKRTVDAGCGRLDVFFMIGLRGQDRESVQGTVRYCGKLMARYPKLSAFISPLAPFIDPGSAAFEEPEKHGYRKLLHTFEEHRTALLAPTWKLSLNYETEWMSRDEIAAASYDAGLELNRLKLRQGRISKKDAAAVEGRNILSRSIMEHADRTGRLPDDPEIEQLARKANVPGMKSLSELLTSDGELCSRSELVWPSGTMKFNLAAAARVLLTGK